MEPSPHIEKWFEPATTATWEKLAIKALKGAHPDEKLRRTVARGVQVSALSVWVQTGARTSSKADRSIYAGME